jgi:hypothetical protein
MTQEEEKYYNNFFELFSSTGWAQILEELEDREAAYDVSYLRDEKDLYKVQGELSIIRMLLNFEDYIERGYAEAQLTSN